MKALWTGVVASAMAFAGVVPQAAAAAGDSFSFNMVQSSGAVSCLKTTARGKVTISDLGPVQNMHIEVFDLPPNTDFTLFVVNTVF